MKTRLALLLPLLLLSACKEDAPAPDPIRPVVSEVITPRIGLQTAYVGTIAARYE
ncbi:efflux transporter periplasmic adaptor subunit, partial [Thioclava sp. BHET1]